MLPAVYRDDGLIADAVQLRRQVGDEQFIGFLPEANAEARERGAANWDVDNLDQALAEPSDGKERRRLVGDLLAGPFQRYAGTVRADQASYIEFDEGLSVIKRILSALRTSRVSVVATVVRVTCVSMTPQPVMQR